MRFRSHKIRQQRRFQNNIAVCWLLSPRRWGGVRFWTLSASIIRRNIYRGQPVLIKKKTGLSANCLEQCAGEMLMVSDDVWCRLTTADKEKESQDCRFGTTWPETQTPSVTPPNYPSGNYGSIMVRLVHLLSKLQYPFLIHFYVTSYHLFFTSHVFFHLYCHFFLSFYLQYFLYPTPLPYSALHYFLI